MYRLSGESMHLSRMSLTNWLEKGSTHFCGLIAYLKNSCLEKDSIVNCDETWCRVKREGYYKKKYIWCLVNKLSKVVVYCYEDGSAKFKYALDQGNDKDAAFILELIGELYRLERGYEEGKLSPE